MSKHLHRFASSRGAVVVALPFHLDEFISDWAGLRTPMRKSVPDDFSRDEWAYLMNFLSPEQLQRPFCEAFGSPATTERTIISLARPRGTVGVWFPNNVSLLGPLILILLSLTGNRLLLKGGSRSNDLAGAFLNFALQHLENGTLRDFLLFALPERTVR